MSNGLVIREGVVTVHKARLYAKRNNIPFIDLRQGLSFANVEQLSNTLSASVSNAFRRPLRANIVNFFQGECFGKRFVAMIPHDFVNDYVLTIQKSPSSIVSLLSAHESVLR